MAYFEESSDTRHTIEGKEHALKQSLDSGKLSEVDESLRSAVKCQQGTTIAGIFSRY